MAHWVGWGLLCPSCAKRPMRNLQKSFLLALLCWDVSQLLSVHAALIPTSVCSLLNVQRLLADEHRAPTPAPEH